MTRQHKRLSFFLSAAFVFLVACAPRTVSSLQPLPTPQGLQAFAGDQRVELRWLGNAAGLTGYRLFRDDVLIYEGLRPSFIDRDVSNGQTYSYVLEVFNNNTEHSLRSEIVTASPQAEREHIPPSAPGGLAALASDSSVRLHWHSNPEAAQQHYQLYRDGQRIYQGSANFFRDEGLENNQLFRYQVRAVDSHGNLSPLSLATSARPVAYADVLAPEVPQGLQAQLDGASGEAQLRWQAGLEPDLAFYRLFREDTLIYEGAATEFLDQGLQPGQRYRYRIAAADSTGNISALSDPLLVSLVPPTTPSGLEAVAGDNRVTLAWQANEEIRLAGYRLYRDGEQIFEGTATRFSDEEVRNETRYLYQISAFDVDNNASPLTEAVAVVPLEPVRIATLDPDILYSPYTWFIDDGVALSNNAGAYLRLGFTGSSLRIAFDTSAFDSSNAGEDEAPRFITRINDQEPRVHRLTGSPELIVATDLPEGEHVLTLALSTTGALNPVNRWENPGVGISITGIEIDNGAHSFRPVSRPQRLLVFGDNISEGFGALGEGRNRVDISDALVSYVQDVAEYLEAELGLVAFSGQGWERNGNGGIPRFHQANGEQAWRDYHSGNSRLPLSPEPDYILLMQGTNDGIVGVADGRVIEGVQSWLEAIREQAPSAQIMVLVPFGGFMREALAEGVANYLEAHQDPQVHFIDLGEAAEELVASLSFDEVNPNIDGHAALAELLIEALEALGIGRLETVSLP